MTKIKGNNFYTALAYEESQLKAANDLYDKMRIANIRRCSWNTEDGRQHQRNDIDFIANLNGKIIHVSEKFRSCNYNDIMIELEDKYNSQINYSGWLFKSQADYIFYHMPNTLYIFETSYLQTFTKPIYEEMFPEFRDKLLNYDTWRLGQSHKLHDILIKHIPTYIMGERVWEGLQMIVPLHYLGNIKIIHK